jgi:hypothetical protein
MIFQEDVSAVFGGESSQVRARKEHPAEQGSRRLAPSRARRPHAIYMAEAEAVEFRLLLSYHVFSSFSLLFFLQNRAPSVQAN